MSKIRPGVYVFEIGTTKNAPIRWWGEHGIFDDPDAAIDAAVEYMRINDVGGKDYSPHPYVRVRSGLWVVWANDRRKADVSYGGASGWKKYRGLMKCKRPAMPGTRLDPTIPTEDLPPRVRNHGIPRDGRRGIKAKFHLTA